MSVTYMYGEDAAAEGEAEEAYREFKARCSGMSAKELTYFAMKVLWYARWRFTHASQDAVEKAMAPYLPGPTGMVSAHSHRPDFIRKPPGGDAFDRGEVSERYDIPM